MSNTRSNWECAQIELAVALLKAMAAHDFRLDVVKEQSPTGDDYNELCATISHTINRVIIGGFDCDKFVKEYTSQLQKEHYGNKGRDKIADAIVKRLDDFAVTSNPVDGVVMVNIGGTNYKVEVKKL